MGADRNQPLRDHQKHRDGHQYQAGYQNDVILIDESV
jgi:hypothetical protein